MADLLRVWDRQPQDTPKSFAAFSEFLKMPIYGLEGEKRTLKNLAKKLGHTTQKQVGLWSAKYKWSERLAAYDAYIGTKEITLIETSLEQVKSAHLQRVTKQASLLSTAIEKRLNQLLQAVDKGEPIDTMDLKRLTDSIDTIDIIMRRSTGQPTTFVSEKGKEVEYEIETYIIGGNQ